MISMLLLSGIETIGAQEVVKVEAGVPFTTEQDGVYVTDAEFIRIVTALDSLRVERAKNDALRDARTSDAELIEALQRRLDFEAESCESLLKVYQEKPEKGFFDKLGEVGIWVTGGYALCTAVGN